MAKLSVDKALLKAKSHSKKGEFQAAKKLYQEVLQAFPKNKRAQLGLAALRIKHELTESKNPPLQSLNELVTLYHQGKLKEAIDFAKNLTELHPKASKVWNIMGAAAAQIGEPEQAILAFQKMLFIDPNDADAHNNIGNIFIKQGKLDEAIEAYAKAISLQTDHKAAFENIGSALSWVTFEKPNSNMQDIILKILSKNIGARPAAIAPAAISLLKFEPNLQQYIYSSCSADVGFSNPQKLVEDLSQLPLLLKLMSSCPVSDTEIEMLFKGLRAAILSNISSLIASPEVYKFQRALALQCFINEYIYNQNEIEERDLSKLESVVENALNNGEMPRSQYILCIAAYKPLHQFEWAKSLQLKDEIQEVLIQQIIEPNKELELKSELILDKSITDAVSHRVRAQYETNPYPRWVNCNIFPFPNPVAKVIDEIELQIFDDEIREVNAPNILVAGCGTGQQSIVTASRFQGSKVIAVDLSLSSLAYARRKTEELGLKNIEYIQADILNLGKLEKSFDIVECLGVLHHMDDPLAGWKVLTDCLKPGGLMKIGLYSTLAREGIKKIRQEIFNARIGSSDEEMRAFRETIVQSSRVHHKEILTSSDFYSLSALRDLLFHVQEHTFTIEEIGTCISDLKLKFCGFELENLTLDFKNVHKNHTDLYELDRWSEYEKANPKTFERMYQFWCQKIM